MIAILLQESVQIMESAGAVDFTWLFIKMLSLLIVVCVLALLILKYLVPKMNTSARRLGGDMIRIMARRHLNPKAQLYIIGVGKKQFLVGATDTQIHYLTDLSGEDLGDSTASKNNQ